MVRRSGHHYKRISATIHETIFSSLDEYMKAHPRESKSHVVNTALSEYFDSQKKASENLYETKRV